MTMKLYYDLHIHTGLSPCGDSDMSPNNIVNMALLKELDCIAITDHNACGNVRAVMEAAAGTELLVIPGMEVETAEEIHVLCLFPHLESATAVWEAVDKSLPGIRNKEEIFGRQLFFDSADNVTGSCDKLLVTATGLSLYELFPLVEGAGGVAIPAHIDRSSYSIVSSLGSIPPDLDIGLVEFSKTADPEAFIHEYEASFPQRLAYLQNSDAHYLGDISERERYLEFEEAPNAEEVIRKLKKL